jgi:MarR family transcriptional regulator, lower aerobic nicotinate degradation pathway regulator
MNEVIDAYVLDDQIGYVLRLASQRHAAIFQRHADHGLTPPQFSVMIRLDAHGTLSQNHLGRLTGLDVATVKGVVDRLCAKGLVAAGADTRDKRLILLTLTPQGRAMIPGLEKVGATVSAETVAPLTQAEQRTLLRLLGRIA